MKPPDWIHFPPLAALRAFEATVRLGGFSAAARALNVTHAAVSQQVRALEAHLGLPLVFRNGRDLSFTPEGDRFGAALTEGFSGVQTVLESLRDGSENQPVTVTLTPSFASNWLMPRLGRFWAAHPDIAVFLRPDPNILDLRREGLDFGIRFGQGNWPGVEARFLASARYLVVGAPVLFAGQKSLTKRQMQRLPWVLKPDLPEQRNWISCCAGLDPDDLRITEFATEELALSAARQGYGLHVSSSALVEEDLASGRLKIAVETDDNSAGYFIVTPSGPLRSSTRTVIRWLLKSA